jgi:hypothetical protein
MCHFRQLFCCCILVAILKLPAFAANVTLVWNASTAPAVAGYSIYHWIAGGTSTNKNSAGKATSLTLSNLVFGTTYYFAATMYDTAGVESPFSIVVSYTVPLAVSASNQPPTLNPFSDLTILENSRQQIVNLSGLTAGATGENQTLTVTAVSSNPALIPNPSVRYISPRPTGTLTFTPMHNAIGTATITVTVNDGQARNNTVTRTFTVTVNPGSTASGGDRGGGGGHGQLWLSARLTNLVVLVGQTRTFSVTAPGRGRLTYQWKFNGSNLSSMVGPVLTLKNITTNQAGTYSVTVSGSRGSTNSTATLTVLTSAAATLAPAVRAGGQYALIVAGVPGYNYVVQASTDLVNWVPVQTNTAPFTFVDTNASQFGQRFYRSVYAP